MVKNRRKKPVVVFFVVIAVGIAVLLYLASFISNSPATLAGQILKTCSSIQDVEKRQECYGKKVTKLMDPPRNLSMKEAFQIAKVVQNKDYPFCHVLGHEIAQKQTRKDPSKWKDVIAACPKGVCANGCSHGALMEKYKFDYFSPQQVDKIMPELKTVCVNRKSWNPTLIERSLCYHGLGHLAMYLTRADVKRSADICDRVTRSVLVGYRQMCYDGVFMQIFQQLDDDDRALVKNIKPKQKEISSFCSKYQGMQKQSCFTESWPLYPVQTLLMPGGIISLCRQIGPDYDPLTIRCYDGMFRIMTIQYQFDPQKIAQYCLALPSDKGSSCFATSASSLIEDNWDNVQPMLFLCDTALQYGYGEGCYHYILERVTYNFPRGSEEFNNFCNKLPEKWRKACSSQASKKTN